MPKRKDPRPICKCKAYRFPHKLGGGKCDGLAFTEYNFQFNREHCQYCNCNSGTYCEVSTGQENLKEGECYLDAVKNQQGETVTLQFEPDKYPF